MNFCFTLCLAAAMVLFARESAAQGSLTPPGPPAPTMKTLAQIEPRTPISALPFTIRASGAYYLTTNLTGSAGNHGISIEAGDVTLDLNGFVLSGASNALNGINLTNTFSNVLLRNGTISRWSIGIEARKASSCRFESLRVHENTVQGLAGGAASAVQSCTFSSNQGIGMSVGPRSLLKDCIARGNSLDGFWVDAGSQLMNCIASDNLRNGIAVSDSCIIKDVLASFNQGAGISAGAELQVTGSKAAHNGGNGISAGSNGLITRCTAAGNLQSGIVAGPESMLLECKAGANTRGIAAQTSSTVRGCSATQNSGDGIFVTSQCTVSGNNVKDNFLARDAAGIHAQGVDNSISDNTAFANDWGFRVDGAGNLIIRNTAANNSLNYYITPEAPQAKAIVVSGQLADVLNPLANVEF